MRVIQQCKTLGTLREMYSKVEILFVGIMALKKHHIFVTTCYIKGTVRRFLLELLRHDEVSLVVELSRPLLSNTEVKCTIKHFYWKTYKQNWNSWAQGFPLGLRSRLLATAITEWLLSLLVFVLVNIGKVSTGFFYWLRIVRHKLKFGTNLKHALQPKQFIAIQK